MGVRNRRREVLERLDSKSLDARFTTEIQQGLNCSPFEAEAVLDVVKEVYFPFLVADATLAPPRKVTLIAVAEPAGKPVALCSKQTVCLTVHRGKLDDHLGTGTQLGTVTGTQLVSLRLPAPTFHQSSQFSTRKPGTLSKSVRLADKRSAWLTSVVAAIFRSLEPM